MLALVENALTDPDPHARWRSLWALGRYDDPFPATARLRAVLASLGDPVALAPLRKLLESEPAQIVVEHAERAVARLEGTG